MGDAIVHIISKRMQALVQKNKFALLLCDLSKAFDCVFHDLLTEKLDHYGISGLPLKLIKSYLHNRIQGVPLNGIQSKILEIKHGVPHRATIIYNLCK